MNTYFRISFLLKRYWERAKKIQIQEYIRQNKKICIVLEIFLHHYFWQCNARCIRELLSKAIFFLTYILSLLQRYFVLLFFTNLSNKVSFTSFAKVFFVKEGRKLDIYHHQVSTKYPIKIITLILQV